jgi:hypothetical protein
MTLWETLVDHNADQAQLVEAATDWRVRNIYVSD